MGAEVRWYDEVDSTNRVASEWLSEGAREGSVVAARFQRSGRGRMGRSWYSPPGQSLMFSVVLRPKVAPGLVSLMAGVAIAQMLRDIGADAWLKWPNDVLIGGRKVCGILGEVVDVPGDPSPGVVVGIGLNVAVEEFPPEMKDATSIWLSTGERLELEPLLERFLGAFWHVYASDAATVLGDYRKMCSTIGRRVRVETATGTIETEALGVDGTGALITKDAGTIRAGDVVHLREPAGLGE